MNKFDASIPRKRFWSTEVGGTQFCPRCHGRLENESHAYLLLVRESGDVQPFIVGNDKGYFCACCPVVVLDYEAFAESAIAGNPSSSSFEFTVPGMVALEAVPEERSGPPLGDEENPIPLVRFTNYAGTGPAGRKRSRGDRRKSHRRSKRRRPRKRSR